MLRSLYAAAHGTRELDPAVDRYLTKPVRQAQLRGALRDLLLSPAARALVPEARREAPGSALERLSGRVLLAEDNVVNQQIAAVMLEGLGIHVDVVENGLEALQALEHAEYDVVLMDCQMPLMDGFEATAELRRRERSDGGQRHVPVLALTANAMDGDQEQCLAAGMDDYLAKPFTQAALQALLTRWLGAEAEAGGQAGGRVAWPPSL